MEKKSRMKFTPRERKFLLELVMKYSGIVDSPACDFATMVKKKRVWFLIQRQFNSVTAHSPRTLKQLKKAWDNHKMVQRMTVSNKRKKIKCTNSNTNESNNDSEPNLDKSLDSSIVTEIGLLQEGQYFNESMPVTEVEVDLSSERRTKKRFKPEEKAFLFSLVQQHADIVDTPDADAASAVAKSRTWQLIQAAFNAVDSHTPRTIKQLRKAWDNHKTKQRTQLRRQNSEAVETRSEDLRVEEELLHDEDFTDMSYSNLLNVEDGLQNFPTKGRHKKQQFIAISPQGGPTKLIKPCGKMNLNIHLGRNSALLALLKREMELNLERAEIEKKKAEMELKHKEEEYAHRRKMRDLEMKTLEEKLKIDISYEQDC